MVYIAIDLKSFYASVECVERGLDPLSTNLVVADASRTSKTICLAVSPSLKEYGIGGRARLFEVEQKVAEINATLLVGEEKLEYLVAPPRMALYIEYSTRIYNIYLKYIAKEDIHVYSIDEVFIDATHYQKIHGLSPENLARKIIQEVYETTGITATAGIGPNLYLCKVAMDIEAKHIQPDKYGARVATLTVEKYRKKMWSHRPITDFWRVGRGYKNKLARYGMYTMGDVARCSLGGEGEFYNEDLLYKLFGVNAELLIDHAWGHEPCDMKSIKAYQPENKSIGSGQVLKCPYTAKKGRLILREMADLLVLDLVDKKLVTDQLVVTVGYDIQNLQKKDMGQKYSGEITTDHYGRSVPKHAHGTINLEKPSSSTKIILEAVSKLYDEIVDDSLLIRRINISANNVKNETEVQAQSFEQLTLFSDYEGDSQENDKEKKRLEKEKKMQLAMIDIKKKFGKNAMIKGMNLEEGAMTIERNGQIGGHKA